MIPAKLKPWPHQEQAYRFAIERGTRGSLLAMDMGTGKSAVVSWLIATPELQVRRCLIACPASVCDVWPKQIELHAGCRCRVVVLDRRATVTRKQAQAAQEYAPRWQEPLVLVVNHEALWREPLGSWASSVPWDLVVVDESHRGAGAAGGKLTMYLRSLGRVARHRIALTGTPMPGGPINMYCQARFLDPSVFGTSATLFRARYPLEDHVKVSLDGTTMRIAAPYTTEMTAALKKLPSRKWFDRSQREWVLTEVSEKLIAATLTTLRREPVVLAPEIEALCRCGDYPEAEAALRLVRPLELDAIRAEFAAKLSTFMFRVEAREVLNLPEALHEVRHCDLDREERRVYNRLRDELVAEVDAGTVTASNALVKLLRLQQVTAGALVTDEGAEVALGTSKRDLLADLLSDLSPREPVVVFSRFRRDLDAVRAVAESHGRRYGELSGRSRDGMTQHATMREDIDVLGAQLQAGGVGVDLTRAHYCVYYSPGFSLGDWLQSLARECRPGQLSSWVRYYHLVARDTVDEDVYAALQAKEAAVDAVISRLVKRAA